MELVKPFESVIGQSRIKNMLSLSATAGANDREMLSLLLQGPAGLGKTKVAMAYVNAITESLPDIKIHCIQPRDIRLIGEEYNSLIETIVSGDPYVIFIDECHELVTDPTKQNKTIFAFIRKALDGNNKGKQIHLADEQFTMFDRKKHVIIMATNFPHVLDKSGALQSRLNTIELDLYTEKELVKITELMAEGNGIIFRKSETENPVERIARCGRGTARFIERIMEQLNLVNNGEPITEKQVSMALKSLKMYPRGLNDKEIMLMSIASSRPINRAQFCAMSQVEPAELRNSIAYMSHPDIRFITQLPSGYIETTKRGNNYLEKCKSLGFDV